MLEGARATDASFLRALPCSTQVKSHLCMCNELFTVMGCYLWVMVYFVNFAALLCLFKLLRWDTLREIEIWEIRITFIYSLDPKS